MHNEVWLQEGILRDWSRSTLMCPDGNILCKTNSWLTPPHHVQLEVSWNGGSPRSSILVGFSHYEPSIWVTPISGNPQFQTVHGSAVIREAPGLQDWRKPSAMASRNSELRRACGFMQNAVVWMEIISLGFIRFHRKCMKPKLVWKM